MVFGKLEKGDTYFETSKIVSINSVKDVHVAFALASSELIHKDIDKMYRDNLEHYHNSYMQDRESIDYLLQVLPLRKREVTRQAMVIVRYTDLLDGNQLLPLFKKAYKGIYRRIEQTKAIHIEQVVDYYDSIKSLLSMDTYLIVVLTIGEYLKKDLAVYDMKSIDYWVRFINDNIEQFDNNLRFSLFGVREMIPNHVKEFRELFMIKGDFSNYYELIQAIVNSLYIYYGDNKIIDRAGGKVDISKLKSPNVHLMQIPALFKIEFDMYLREAKLTKNEQDKLFSDVMSSIEVMKNRMNTDAKKQEYGILIVIQAALIKHIHEMHDYIKSKDVDGKLIEIEHKQREVNRLLNEIEKERATHKNEVNQLSKRLDTSNKDLTAAMKQLNRNENDMKRMQREIEQLKAQNESLKSEIDELANFDESEATFEQMIEVIKSHKIVIIGGFKDWQRKLSEINSSFKFVHTEQLNKDLSFIHQYNYIFYVAEYANHSMFEKLKGEGVEFNYLENKNPKLTIKKIYETIINP